jgi:hypothetical protein
MGRGGEEKRTNWYVVQWVAKVGNYPPTPRVVMESVFAEYPLRHSMDLVELGARSMDLVDLEFLELGCLTGKKWSGAVFWI